MLNLTIPRHSLSMLLIAMLALAVSACEGTTLGHFDVEDALPETRIEGNAVVPLLPALFPAMPLNVSANESFKQEDYDYLTSVQVDSLMLRITESSSDESVDTLEDGTIDDFNFLTSMEIYISAEIDGETVREIIGSITMDDPQLSAAVQQISFSMTGLDILPYVEAQNGYEVQIEAVGEAPPDAVIFDGDIRYRVGIGFR